MAHLTDNRALRWLAPVALVGSIGLVACGDDSGSDVSARTAAAPSGVDGSDVHLGNLAAEIDGRSLITSGSDVHLLNLAAEASEREAHVVGNATTTIRAAEGPDTVETSNDDFVPGTRRMPVR